MPPGVDADGSPSPAEEGPGVGAEMETPAVVERPALSLEPVPVELEEHHASSFSPSGEEAKQEARPCTCCGNRFEPNGPRPSRQLYCPTCRLMPLRNKRNAMIVHELWELYPEIAEKVVEGLKESGRWS